MGTNTCRRRIWQKVALAAMCCLIDGAGCRRSVSPPAPVPTTPQVPTARPVAATQPVTLLAGEEALASPLAGPASAPATRGEQTFENQSAGIRFHYAGDWIEQKSPDDLLMLVPVKGPNSRTISLDVPKIPGHLPGIMTMPLVENGFVDDLRKQHKGLKVEETKDQTVAKSKARLVRSTWKENGKDFTDCALLIVHADRVYILSLDSDLEGYAAVRAAMDHVVDTVEWIK